MKTWKPGDRVEHATFGSGTVLEFNEQHAVVHFDDHGRRKFASNLVVLKEGTPPAPAPRSRLSRTSSERTTDIATRT